MACTRLQSRRVNRTPLSSSYRKEELCYCTEELGSESISYRGAIQASNLCTALVTLQQGQHGLSSHTASANLERNVLLPAEGAEGKCILQLAGSLTSCQQYEAAGNCSQLNSDRCIEAPPARQLFAGRSSSPHSHTFPPPLSSLLSERLIMRSVKSNGRFVLQRVNNISGSPFRSVRENGRLRLYLDPSISAAALDSYKKAEHQLADTKSCYDQSEGSYMDEEDESGEVWDVSEEAEEEGIKCSVLLQPTDDHMWVPRRVMLLSMSCSRIFGGARSDEPLYGYLRPAFRLILVKARGLISKGRASQAISGGHGALNVVGPRPRCSSSGLLPQQYEAEVPGADYHGARHELIVHEQQLDSTAVPNSLNNMSHSPYCSRRTQLISPAKATTYTSSSLVSAAANEHKLGRFRQCFAASKNAISSAAVDPAALLVSKRRRSGSTPASYHAILSVSSLNSLVQLLVLLEGSSAAGRSFLRIKDIDFLYPADNCQAPPATSNSITALFDRGESSSAALLNYAGDQAQYSCTEYNLSIGSSYTLHAFKPIDFRIAA